MCFIGIKEININNELTYKIDDVVRFYLYSFCYYWGMDLEIGNIVKITNKFYYIKLWGPAEERIYRVPKVNIVNKCDQLTDTT